MSWRSRLSKYLRREARRVEYREPHVQRVIHLITTTALKYPRGIWPWRQSLRCGRMMMIRGHEMEAIKRHSKENRRRQRG